MFFCDVGVRERLENSAIATEISNGPVYNLFAFPAEDNFAGVKYPLTWVEQIKAKSTSAVQWKVLLDAAAYVPTQPLDLSKVPADFVVMSFYKMFGYPTGLGALLVRVEAAELLQKVGQGQEEGGERGLVGGPGVEAGEGGGGRGLEAGDGGWK